VRATALALTAAVALAASACGSDLGPEPAKPARLLRVAVVAVPASERAVWEGVRAAARFVGARRVGLAGDPDVVLTRSAQAALRAARRDSSTHVVLIGSPAPDGAPANLLGVVWSRPQLAYLAGAVAALRAPSVAMAGADALLARAFARGARALAPAVRTSQSGCRRSGAPIVYAPSASCLPAGPGWLVAPQPVPGRRMLALVAPRLDVVVAKAVRSVQDASFAGGRTVEWGLFEDAVGVRRLSSSLPAGAVERLQRLEDRVRSGDADVPVG
jgi:hypothetical protein